MKQMNEKYKNDERITIRHATLDDLELLRAVELECFGELEAATPESMKARVEIFPDCFWLLFVDDELVSFIDGFCTDEEILTDEMFADASMHQKNGKWQMIFGVNTRPDYRCKGYAARTMEAVIEDSRKRGKAGLILTCKDFRIPYYSKFGYQTEFKSESTHGGAEWYQMKIEF